jgi:hypothetical protein
MTQALTPLEERTAEERKTEQRSDETEQRSDEDAARAEAEAQRTEQVKDQEGPRLGDLGSLEE